jgi:hypothetical protein
MKCTRFPKDGDMVSIPRHVAEHLADLSLGGVKSNYMFSIREDIPDIIQRALVVTSKEEEEGLFFDTVRHAYNYRTLMQALGKGADLSDPLKMFSDHDEFWAFYKVKVN